jgi:hypothetical protein
LRNFIANQERSLPVSISNASRRQVLRLAAACVSGLAVKAAFSPSEAAELTPLSPSDALAQALGYVVNASIVDAKTNPQFKAGSNCANCLQFEAQGAASGTCKLFPGKLVATNGWCRVWAAKPS